MESEFFGYVKGAFTDASGNKKGLIESAEGGTLFLDEVGELPLMLQVKILRFLQETEIRRVGETTSRKVDVRIVAATAKDLKSEVEKGAFREDLFYRLNVVPIRIPALRERPEDIAELANYFLQQASVRLGIKHLAPLGPDVLRTLMGYQWPGNVRELENLMERAAVLSDSHVISLDSLPDYVKESAEGQGYRSMFTLKGLSIKQNAQILEKSLITRALEETGQNRTRAAKLLEISHRALLYKLKEYDLGRTE